MFDRVYSALLFPFLLAALHIVSACRGLQALRSPNRVLLSRDHDAQPILVFALYQKGRLRPDIVRFLKTARALGFYVVAVNTRQLLAPDDHCELFDVYIERFNHGRDFGSYKAGITHILNCSLGTKSPRIVLANDSVYYSQRQCDAFLQAMLASDIEVLGSTENHEIRYHLGSFFLSISPRILGHPGFGRWWRQYRNCDVRRSVIFHGEMGLSGCLTDCASSPDQVQCLYTAARFLESLEGDAALDRAIAHARTSPGDWKRLDWARLAREFIARYALDPISHAPGDPKIELDQGPNDRLSAVNSLDDFVAFLRLQLREPERLDTDLVRRFITAQLGEVFVSGSQIHQNAALLLSMGLPLIKLDGLYRGMFSVQDVETICSLLDPVEAQELRRLLMSRPYGGKTLTGWRRAAFLRGLI